jgi:hypothetical protein
MTYLVERLAEVRRHVDNLRQIAPPANEALERDMWLRNDRYRSNRRGNPKRTVMGDVRKGCVTATFP